MCLDLPDLLAEVWARALPGRECAERNEALRLQRACYKMHRTLLQNNIVVVTVALR